MDTPPKTRGKKAAETRRRNEEQRRAAERAQLADKAHERLHRDYLTYAGGGQYKFNGAPDGWVAGHVVDLLRQQRRARNEKNPERVVVTSPEIEAARDASYAAERANNRRARFDGWRKRLYAANKKGLPEFDEELAKIIRESQSLSADLGDDLPEVTP